MRKIFHKEFEYDKKMLNRYCQTTDKIGLVVLEQPPHSRTLVFNSNKTFARVFLPYTQFYISYTISNGKYVYHGLFYNGLKVSFSKNPIKHIFDKVAVPPQDRMRNGIVCTPHTFEECEEVYDHKQFDSLEEMQKAIISLYWGLTHNNINWSKRTQEEVLEECMEWEEKYSFKNYVSLSDYDASDVFSVFCSNDDDILD